MRTRLFFLSICLSALALGQTAVPAPAAGTSYFVNIGAEYNHYSNPVYTAGTVSVGVCGVALCGISTVELQPKTATYRADIGYQLKAVGNVRLIALAGGGVTRATTPAATTVDLANVGGGLLLRYDLGGISANLKDLGISAGMRIAAVSGVSVQAEFLFGLSYWFK